MSAMKLSLTSALLVLLLEFCILIPISNCNIWSNGKINSGASQSNFTADINQLIINGFKSPWRPFYVKVRLFGSGGLYCGGTIIDTSWVVTAAHCVNDYPPEDVIVIVKDFDNEKAEPFLHLVTKIVVHKDFQMSSKPLNDIALLQLWAPIRGGHRILPVCKEEMFEGTRLGTCGMGATFTTAHANSRASLPNMLVELHLTETKYLPEQPTEYNWCRIDNICTKPVTVGGNICVRDDGGPLYTFECDSNIPECLYGIASYSTSAKENQEPRRCTTGSYFVNVPRFRKWITAVVGSTLSPSNSPNRILEVPRTPR